MTTDHASKQDLTSGTPLPFGPFPSPYGDAVNEPIFDQLVHTSLIGEIFGAEPTSLPPNTTLTVRLLDISLSDAPEITLAQTSIHPAETLPMRFELPYDHHQIRRGHTYSISGTIRSGSRLLYANDCTHLVFTGSNVPFIRLRVASVG